jgi:hypothetical protein
VIELPGNDGGGKSQSMVEACATQTSKAEPAPLDIYILLDISGSMLEKSADGQQKWGAIKSAITSFLMDPGSAGIGVGIQYFPLRKPGVPATCSKANPECGSGGSCFLKRCQSYPVPGGVAQCNSDADCKNIPAAVNYGPCLGNTCRSATTMACTKDADCLMPEMRDFGPCEEFGQCANDRSRICAVGQDCGGELGMCVEAESSICFHGTQCTSDGYATPAVAIAPVEQSGPAIIASIEAQAPDGDTPSAVALKGGIEHARAWAASHPGHTVVTVLATDGLPTECLPDTQRFTETVAQRDLVVDVANIAYEGSVNSPSIPTFVIGVFSQSDATAPENLKTIADAGGTQNAQIVDTSGDVAFQFLRALNAIRKSQLACEYQIPAPEEGKTLDYGAVNMDLVEGEASSRLYFVRSADRCDAEGGWYYDADPNVGKPTKILVCPSTCSRFQNAGAGAVQIKLGCETQIR